MIREAFNTWGDTLHTSIQRNITAPADGARIRHKKDSTGLSFGDYFN